MFEWVNKEKPEPSNALAKWFIGPLWPEAWKVFPWRYFTWLSIGSFIACLLVLNGVMYAFFGTVEISDPERQIQIVTWSFLISLTWFVLGGLVLAVKWIAWKVKQSMNGR